jgi:hypothetical protein
MSAPRTELWALVDRVRERGYNWLTLAEKKRLHDLVLHLKARGTIPLGDLQWLRQADESLSLAGSLEGTFKRRRKGGRS